MRAGDRAAAARFVMGYGPRIRRRIRGKLSRGMRRVFDSQDILSTLGRRLDEFVRSGRVAASSEPELWGLVFRIAENAVIDKARTFQRLRRAEAPDGDFARDLAGRLQEAERRHDDGAAIEISRMLEALDDPLDRQILGLWLAGNALNVIAVDVAMQPAAVRKRWERIKRDLERRFSPELRRDRR